MYDIKCTLYDRRSIIYPWGGCSYVSPALWKRCLRYELSCLIHLCIMVHIFSIKLVSFTLYIKELDRFTHDVSRGYYIKDGFTLLQSSGAWLVKRCIFFFLYFTSQSLNYMKQSGSGSEMYSFHNAFAINCDKNANTSQGKWKD